MNIRFNLTIGALFILAGALLSSENIIRYLHDMSSSSTNLSSQASPAKASVAKSIQSAQPTHISLPRVQISIDIEPGYYNASSESWTLSDTKAQFATITPWPNTEGGNTYVYGHNRPAIFGNLHNTKLGDEAVVTTANGHTYTYKLASSREVKPTDVSLFNYKGEPILTLQTCSGIWDQNRRLFVFNLEKVS